MFAFCKKFFSIRICTTFWSRCFFATKFSHNFIRCWHIIRFSTFLYNCITCCPYFLFFFFSCFWYWFVFDFSTNFFWILWCIYFLIKTLKFLTLHVIVTHCFFLNASFNNCFIYLINFITLFCKKLFCCLSFKKCNLWIFKNFRVNKAHWSF